jgi:DNA-directed RNA polymerase subunit L
MIYNKGADGRSDKLQVQTTSEDEKGLTVEITGEDYSLAEIVHHELLEEKSVTFAGVLPPHPLIKKLVLKVRAQRVKPEKAFVNSVQRAIETTQELSASVRKELGGASV